MEVDCARRLLDCLQSGGQEGNISTLMEALAIFYKEITGSEVTG